MDYGARTDGTAKGIGYFGPISRPGGGVSTELSIGVDGRDMPALVPTLTRQEIAHLAGGGEVTDPIVGKAVAHARGRDASGMSPFAGDNEPNTVNMQMLRQGVQSRALRGRR